MVKTAATASAQDFFSLLEKSGLIDDRIAEIQALVAGSSDARSLAKQLIAQSVVTKWQATQLLNGFSQFKVGKYRLQDQIGVGRIGREFLAEHLHLGKRVAIKLVSRTLTADETRLKKFLADARQAMGLDHPHLVHSYDVDQEGQRYYVVTEFVDGEDLQRRVQQSGPCSLAEAVGLISQAAEGLQHAAVGGVLHGDLKPSNLLVDKQGSLKVADLGFAKLVDGAPNSTPSKNGKDQNLQDGVEYCAPEALNHVEGDLDCRSDIFSLGQTLYFLITGKSPPAPADSSLDRSSALLATKGANQQVASVFATFTSPQVAERPATWKQALEILRSLDVKSLPSTPATASNAGKRKPPVAKAIALPEDNVTVVEPVESESSAADEPAIAETPAFVIKTNDNHAGRGRSAAATASSPASEPTAEPANAKTGKPTKPKKLDPKLVIGVGIGGGVLLILVSVLGLWMLLGGGSNPPKVTEKPKDKNQTTATDPDSKSTTPGEENPEEKNPEEKNPVEKNPEPEKPEPMPPVKPETTVAVAPEVKPEPKPDPEPKPEPTVPTPEPKPEPTVPTPEPKPEPAPQPAGKPFEKLPAFVSLPEPANTEKATLGDLAVPNDRGLRILMHGGEGATKNKMSFSLENANAGTDERNWEVLLNKTIVAKLHREPDKLTFEWTAEAAGQASSPCLGNCLLQLNAGTDEHFLALRAPVEVDPITMDFEKGVKWNATVENLPSSTVVELVGLDQAAFPNADFKTETAGKIKGLVMWYGGSFDTRNLGLLIDKKDTSKRIDVRLDPVYRFDPQAKDTTAAQRLTKKFLPQQQLALDQNLKSLTIQSAAIDKGGGSAEDKERSKNLINADIKNLQDQLNRINSAAELVKMAHDTAQIHIRVSYDTGAGKVVLAQTKGAPPSEPPGKKLDINKLK